MNIYRNYIYEENNFECLKEFGFSDAWCNVILQPLDFCIILSVWKKIHLQ